MVGPLSGVRVVDFTRAMAGPMATMMLGDMGADVVKIEPPEGDETRGWGPPFADGESTYFISANRNKKSVCINLKAQEGLEIAKKLIRDADVLVENFRPGVMAKLGLDYATLSADNPGLVYCSISGFGQKGPWSSKPGYDLIALSESGLLGLTGEPHGEPVKFGVPAADIASGMMGAYAIMCALYWRHKTGRGQYIDASLYDTMLYWLTHQGQAYLSASVVPTRMGSQHPNIAPYRVYRTADSYITICVGNEPTWQKMCEALGLTELLSDERFSTNSLRVKNRVALDELISSKLAGAPTSTWLSKLESRGVPCAGVKNVAEAVTNIHNDERNSIERVRHSELGEIRMLFTPPKMSQTEAALTLPPPALGEHTEHVLVKLGYPKESIRKLAEKGVVRIPDDSANQG